MRVGASRLVAGYATVADPASVSGSAGIAAVALGLAAARVVAAVWLGQRETFRRPPRATTAARIARSRAARLILWSMCSPVIACPRTVVYTVGLRCHPINIGHYSLRTRPSPTRHSSLYRGPVRQDAAPPGTPTMWCSMHPKTRSGVCLGLVRLLGNEPSARGIPACPIQSRRLRRDRLNAQPSAG